MTKTKHRMGESIELDISQRTRNVMRGGNNKRDSNYSRIYKKILPIDTFLLSSTSILKCHRRICNGYVNIKQWPRQLD